jgi:hypothetical protein
VLIQGSRRTGNDLGRQFGSDQVEQNVEEREENERACHHGCGCWISVSEFNPKEQNFLEKNDVFTIQRDPAKEYLNPVLFKGNSFLSLAHWLFTHA